MDLDEVIVLDIDYIPSSSWYLSSCINCISMDCVICSRVKKLLVCYDPMSIYHQKCLSNIHMSFSTALFFPVCHIPNLLLYVSFRDRFISTHYRMNITLRNET